MSSAAEDADVGRASEAVSAGRKIDRTAAEAGLSVEVRSARKAFATLKRAVWCAGTLRKCFLGQRVSMSARRGRGDVEGVHGPGDLGSGREAGRAWCSRRSSRRGERNSKRWIEREQSNQACGGQRRVDERVTDVPIDTPEAERGASGRWEGQSGVGGAPGEGRTARHCRRLCGSVEGTRRRSERMQRSGRRRFGFIDGADGWR